MSNQLPPGPCARYEPNNSLATAFGPLANGSVIEAGLCQGDPDEYYYVLLESTAWLQLDLTNIPPGTNYDLYLYRGTEAIASSEEPGTSPERLRIRVGGGRYDIRIYPRSGRSSQPYKLIVGW